MTYRCKQRQRYEAIAKRWSELDAQPRWEHCPAPFKRPVEAWLQAG